VSAMAGTTNLDQIAAAMRESAPGFHVSLALALAGMLAVAIAESGRMPIDNPASHLELTMMHEAMLLEYSGRHLAMLDYASALRLLIWFNLIATIFLPFGIAAEGAGLFGWIGGVFGWAVKMLVLVVVLAVWETMLARLRLLRAPEFLGIAMLLAVLAAMLLFVSQGIA
jgi:formate hydrogenlyase subunit 4